MRQLPWRVATVLSIFQAIKQSVLPADHPATTRRIARPAVSEQRLSLTPTGKVRYELKTPFRNRTTHVIFEPLDFIARQG